MKVSLKTMLIKLNNIMITDKFMINLFIQNTTKKNYNQNWRQQISSLVIKSHQRVINRQKSVPIINYPNCLPINKNLKMLADTIKKYQVIIVSGETGSGKTTQLPKICLELGRGIIGMIGHTQPRRIAAYSIAHHLAHELTTTVGDIVGFKIRFKEQISDNTLIKLMTDGILLTEIQYDRLLSSYDTLIIDEAHERSLNIDYILGYLHQLLPQRPDLKLIITSATIDLMKFSRHFHNAPIIEITTRQYPIEVRYRPLKQNQHNEENQIQGVIHAIHELNKESNGDILIFISSEHEIHNLAKRIKRLNLSNTEILLLYAHLSYLEQNKVFSPIFGKKRIILATNIAETSLTIPRITYVIDSGKVRISRYSFRKKIQRLPIESISQASANQRKGRCGRVEKGICIRLYSEQDFLCRPIFSEPEILRTHLSSIILQMLALELGDITSFPFIDMPKVHHIQDGIRLLEELGVIIKDEHYKYYLNSLGKQLAQLPLDPRLARMVLSAKENNCVQEIIIIVSALSIQDPRERSIKNIEMADKKHKRFINKKSDFITLINIWEYLNNKQKSMSVNQFRRQCRIDYFNYLKVCEWQDIYTQLCQIIKMLGINIDSQPINYKLLHCSLLTGLLSNIGFKNINNQEYIGTRNIHFNIHPRSFYSKKSPKWIVVFELIETNRLWGCVSAQIESNWIEPIALHIIKRSYSTPYWDRTLGIVLTLERVTLLGLPIVTNRKINYESIDHKLCRLLFIRYALIKGDWNTNHKFFYDNMKLKHKVEMLEHKLRHRNILVSDKELFIFYDQRIDKNIFSQKDFDLWWEKTQQEDPTRLNFNYSMLIRSDILPFNYLDYPDFWNYHNILLKLSYQFEPNNITDGVSVYIPLLLLNQIYPIQFEWQIPGLRYNLITALIKSLPVKLRCNFIPIYTYATTLFKEAKSELLPLLDYLEQSLQRITGVIINRKDWQWNQVPNYLKINFIIIDYQNNILAISKNLNELKFKLHKDIRNTLDTITNRYSIYQDIRNWNFGDILTEQIQQQYGGYEIILWPAIVANNKISIKIFNTKKEQQHAMLNGTRRLLLLNLSTLIKCLYLKLFKFSLLEVYNYPGYKITELMEDCIICTIDKLITNYGGIVWKQNDYLKLKKYITDQLEVKIIELFHVVKLILKKMFIINQQCKNKSGDNIKLSLSDIKNQCNNLVYPGFITASGWDQLPNILRYLNAIEIRLNKLSIDPNQDYILMIKIKDIQRLWQDVLHKLPLIRHYDNDVLEINWMIEELRISYFAQQIKTIKPVSLERIQTSINKIIYSNINY